MLNINFYMSGLKEELLANQHSVGILCLKYVRIDDKK